MATEVILPLMGLTMTEGTITRWLKKEGDMVEAEEPLFEMMTDKSNVEIESPASGVLLKVLVPEEATVPIGTVVAYIGKPGEKLDNIPAAPVGTGAVETPAEKETTQTKTVAAKPQLKEGEKISISPRAKKTAERLNVDYTAITGTGTNSRIEERDVIAFAESAAAKAGLEVKMTPLAKKIASENGISTYELVSLKDGGRVNSEDIKALQKSKAAAVAEQHAVAPERIPFKGIRKVIADRMSQSAHTIPRVTHSTEVDFTETVKLREKLLPEIEKTDGFRISYNDILVKVCAKALRDFPNINASLGDGYIELHPYVNIGVAVSTDAGLVVPVIRDADKLSIREIGLKFKALVKKARDGKLMPDDMNGGTFTISNLGMYDIDMFTPIINLPEVAILGVGRIVTKPRYVGGELVPRKMMILSLTFDHRVNDGGPAAEFLQRIKFYLENPLMLLS